MPLASADCRVVPELRPRVPRPKSNCFCANRNQWLVCRFICNCGYSLGASAFRVEPIQHTRRSCWWRGCDTSVRPEAADLGLIERLEAAVPASCPALIGRAHSRSARKAACGSAPAHWGSDGARRSAFLTPAPSCPASGQHFCGLVTYLAPSWRCARPPAISPIRPLHFKIFHADR